MNVKSIMNLGLDDISKMSRKELAGVTSILASAVNKRVKRFNNKGEEPPAVASLKRSGGNISVKDKNLNQLRQEFSRAKNFLDLKTSTAKGFKAVKDELVERLGVPMNKEQTDRMWKAYNRLTETEGYFVKYFGSAGAQKHLHDVVDDNPLLSADELVEIAQNRIKALYEKEAKNNPTKLFDMKQSTTDNADEENGNGFFKLGGNRKKR